MGLSPGRRNRWPRRNRHTSLTQPTEAPPSPAGARSKGRTKPTSRPRPWSSTRARRRRSSGSSSFAFSGSTSIGRLASSWRWRHGSSKAGWTKPIEPEPARDSSRRSGAHPRRWRGYRGHGFPPRSRAAGRRGGRTPRAPSAAGSRPDTTCPARNAAARPARSGRAACGSVRRASACLVGPMVAIFHSGDSRSSTETKVSLLDGQPHVTGLEIAVDLFAEAVDAPRSSIRERPGDPRAPRGCA